MPYDDKKKKKTTKEKLAYTEGKRKVAATRVRNYTNQPEPARKAAMTDLGKADNAVIQMRAKAKSEAAQSAFKNKDYEKIKGKTGSY